MIESGTHPPTLVDLLPNAVAQAVQNLPENYVNRPERDLKKLLKPSHLASRLRLQFWLEYERALSTGKNMKVENIVAGCCPPEMFYQFVLKDPKQVGWIACPPADYMISLRANLKYAMDEVEDILEKPLPRHNLKASDVKLAALKVEIWKSLEERVHGAVIQKVEAKHLHAHQKIPAPEDRTSILKELKNEHRGVIEVDVKEED